MQRQRPFALLMAIALLAGQLADPGTTSAAGESNVLPDLGMLPPKDFSIQSRPRGVRWLRFEAVVVNVGPGLFDVYGAGEAFVTGWTSSTPIVSASSTFFASPHRARYSPRAARPSS